MGVVLNPVGFRIGHIISWSDAWYMHRINYPAFLHNVLLIKTLIYYLIFYCYPEKRSLWVYSHLSLYMYNYKIFVNVYIYSAFDNIVVKFLVRKLKYKKFKSIRLKTYWYKKQILDQNFGLQNAFIILQVLRLNVDKIVLDNIEAKYSFWKVKKIKKLKKKYGRKNWMSREEVFMLKRVFSSFLYGYNMFGFDYLANYYKKTYFKGVRRPRYTDGYRTKHRNLGLKILRYNYKYFFFLFTFLDFMAKKYNQAYPYRNFRRRTYTSMIKLFFFWFCIRPIFTQYSKLIELLILKFGFRVKARMFILNNACLSALFMARYFAFAFKYKFNFKDMMKPLKKTLRRLMFVRRRIRGEKVSNRLIRYKKLMKRKVLDAKRFLLSVVGTMVLNIILKLKLNFFKSLICFKKKYHYKNLKTIRFFFFNFLRNSYCYKILWHNNVWWYKATKDGKCFTDKSMDLFNKKEESLLIIRYIKISKFFLFRKVFVYIRNLFYILKKVRIRWKFFKFFRNNAENFSNKLLSFKKSLYLKQFINNFLKFNFFKKLKKIKKIKFNFFFNILILNFFNSIRLNFLHIYSNSFYYFYFPFSLKLFNYFKIDRVFALYNLGRTFERIYTKINYHLYRVFTNKKKYKFNLKKIRWKFLAKVNKPENYFYTINNNRVFNNKYFFKKLRKFRKPLIYSKFMKFFFRSNLPKRKFLKKHEVYFKFSKKLKKKTKWMWDIYSKRLRIVLGYNLRNLTRIIKLYNLMGRRQYRKSLKYINNKKSKLKLQKKNRKNDPLWKITTSFIKTLNKNRKRQNQEFLKIRRKKRKQRFLLMRKKKILFTEFSHFLQNLTFYFFWRKFSISFFLYKPYIFNVDLKLKYFKKLAIFKNYYRRFLLNLKHEAGEAFSRKKILPLRYKLNRLKYFDNELAVLYGYKFHFKGRFTRKQRAASLWFSKGAVSSSAMNANVDYGFYTIRLRYSVCTVKIWLYKGPRSPIFRFRVI